MPNVSLIRDHEGAMDLAVAGHYALGARVMSIVPNNQGEMVVVVQVPVKDVVFEERSTVVPFKGRNE